MLPLEGPLAPAHRPAEEVLTLPHLRPLLARRLAIQQPVVSSAAAADVLAPVAARSFCRASPDTLIPVRAGLVLDLLCRLAQAFARALVHDSQRYGGRRRVPTEPGKLLFRPLLPLSLGHPLLFLSSGAGGPFPLPALGGGRKVGGRSPSTKGRMPATPEGMVAATCSSGARGTPRPPAQDKRTAWRRT